MRTRIHDHSPSFSFEDADLDRLIEVVTENSARPRIRADGADELTETLLEKRALERRNKGVPAASEPRKPAAPPPAPSALPPAPSPAPPPAPSAEPAAPPRPVLAAPPPELPGHEPRRPLPLRLLGGTLAVLLALLRFGARAVRAVGRGLKRILPSSTKLRLALAGAIVLIIAGAFGINHYLSNVPDQLADDYRDKAQPATERITDAMDGAYAAFDNYLDSYTLNIKQTRNVDEIEEYQRRWLNLYDQTSSALDRAGKSIRKTRKLIAERRQALRGVPTAPLLGGSDPVKEAEEAEEAAVDYVKGITVYLREFQRFVDYDRKALALRRQKVENFSENTYEAGASLESIKAALAADLKLAEEVRAGYAKLKPPPDAKRRHEVSLEGATISVDYIRDLQEGLANLNIAELDAADAQFLSSAKRVDAMSARAAQLFNSKSGLQRKSRALEKEGDRLEESVMDLGTGDPDRAGRHDRYRVPAPPAPPPKKGKGGDNDERSVS